jgi:septal ring factor EnvC (AmiA/AmiB activator)
MTTERWTDNMLDRLVGAVSALTDLSERNTRDISSLGQSVVRLTNVAQQHQQNFEVILTELQRQSLEIREIQVEVREIQVEVRGLQTENRRILDQLINRGDDQV